MRHGFASIVGNSERERERAGLNPAMVRKKQKIQDNWRWICLEGEEEENRVEDEKAIRKEKRQKSIKLKQTGWPVDQVKPMSSNEKKNVCVCK